MVCRLQQEPERFENTPVVIYYCNDRADGVVTHEHSSVLAPAALSGPELCRSKTRPYLIETCYGAGALTRVLMPRKYGMFETTRGGRNAARHADSVCRR